MTKNWLVYITLSCAIIIFIVPLTVYAQKMTRIKGVVIDASTKEALPFVTIGFVGKNIGTVTDFDGSYTIESQWASKEIEASYIGYTRVKETIKIGETNIINFALESTFINLSEIVITAKKKRYRNKNNPAVALIREVIRSKKLNRKENLSYYKYDKYEKVEFDLNNITQKFRERKIFKEFQFMFDYVDTSDINGKPILPVFLKETISKKYYRKSPKKEKEYVSGMKMIGLPGVMDGEGVSAIVDNIYQEVDIYDNSIILLTNQFVSPIAKIAPLVYKFHIIDTIILNGYRCINLAYQPRNKADLAFKGNLYIAFENNHAVIKADLRITKDISLNFVDDLLIVQEFEFLQDKVWMLSKDKLYVDFNLGKKGVGIFGEKTVLYDNFLFDVKEDDAIYAGIDNIINEKDYDKRSDQHWANTRFEKLSKKEKNIYVMTADLQKVPAFIKAVDILNLVASGYYNMGRIDLGSLFTFFSFNDVEGLRLKIGGKTSNKFSDKIKLDGYLIYGFKDRRYKYSGSALFSLNNKAFLKSPKHTIMAMYQRETTFPGMELQFINEDNFILSFKRGIADKILYYDMFKVEHYKDWGNGLSTTTNFRRVVQEPGGSLIFKLGDSHIEDITFSEISTTLRYAPNEVFYQGVNFKTTYASKYPIFSLSYTRGLKGLFSSEYNYNKIKLNAFKRFNITPIGFTKFELEAGKIFSKGVPFPLLYVHRANQTYSFQLHSYNMMNFLEFVNDEYAALFFEHNFYGFFFNRIPLLKRLKIREIISFKGIYGGFSDKNNPKESENLIKFPVDEFGNPTTFILQGDPYIEGSVGIGNLFKFLRIDLIRRFTYLDNPNVSRLGIRGRIVLDF